MFGIFVIYSRILSQNRKKKSHECMYIESGQTLVPNTWLLKGIVYRNSLTSMASKEIMLKERNTQHHTTHVLLPVVNDSPMIYFSRTVGVVWVLNWKTAFLFAKTVCTEGYVMHIRHECLHIQTDDIRKHLLCWSQRLHRSFKLLAVITLNGWCHSETAESF
jgi:hypothetical protein